MGLARCERRDAFERGGGACRGVAVAGWNPLASTAIETHTYGSSGDVLIVDAVGRRSPDAWAAVGSRSDLVVYAASNSLGPATIRRCSFPAGAATCPAGTEQAISVPGGSPRTEAFALSDMDGDGLPELCTYDPHAQTVRCARSLSGYTSFHTVSFSNPTFPYQISGGVLL